jgi:thiol:disulfide interchange protein
MKKYLILTILFLINVAAFAQIETPVKWSYGIKKINKNQAIVFVKANIDKGWHIYSQTVKDGGPVKTSIKFIKADDYATAGSSTAPKPIVKYEEAFKTNVEYYENQVIFQQKVNLKTGQPIIKGIIQYMVCNSKECLPPEDVEFTVAVK